MTDGSRHLPIFDDAGHWIARPDLFLLARMAYRDKDEDEVVAQLYDVMCRADNTRSTLNLLEQDTSKRHVARQTRPRIFAGTVVLEYARIRATPAVKPTIAAAKKLVARGQIEFDGKRAQFPSVLREVDKGFSEYRNTAHLQAALLMTDSRGGIFEGSEAETVGFLSRARALETLLDVALAGERLKWSPWRIPERIPVGARFDFPPLDDDEVKFLSSR